MKNSQKYQFLRPTSVSSHTPHEEQEQFHHPNMQRLARVGSVRETPDLPVVKLNTRAAQKLLGPVVLGAV